MVFPPPPAPAPPSRLHRGHDDDGTIIKHKASKGRQQHTRAARGEHHDHLMNQYSVGSASSLIVTPLMEVESWHDIVGGGRGMFGLVAIQTSIRVMLH